MLRNKSRRTRGKARRERGGERRERGGKEIDMKWVKGDKGEETKRQRRGDLRRKVAEKALRWSTRRRRSRTRRKRRKRRKYISA